MKRNNLTTAVVAAIAGVAGFAGLANAVDLNPDGIGQALIYPYYTVNASQNSLFSVVNTTDVSKAVKVRFLEGYNSREVLDFNLFLSPHDVWTAAVSETLAGGAAVATYDKSCTFPKVTTGGIAFRTSYFDGSFPTISPKDGGPTGLERTREGYLEMITMGDIIPGSPLDNAVTHVQDGTPGGGVPACGASLGGDLTSQLVAPTSGLFGSGGIVNVPQGTFYGYNADAIDGFTSTRLYTLASLVTPSLAQANSATASLPGGAVAYVFASGGSLLTLDYAKGIDAVSAVFTADAIYNEWQVDANNGSNTDWVVNFPTKRFYVDPANSGSATAITPFVNVFNGKSNIGVGISVYDQEEGTPEITACGGFSPPNPGETNCGAYLPYELNVISFLDVGVSQSAVFGSKLVSNIQPYGSYGWLRLDFVNDPTTSAALDGGVGHALRPTTNGDVLLGLPATGFQAFNLINANANPGVLANYGGVFRHRASRTCTNDQNTPNVCS